ncbi:MAG TPA: hypothetical protein DCQ92_13320 [Verrucomicrobia subdivision 3 bacterium]|nr:hypothetical protein [Limisphaerales bacterium]
MRVLRLDEKLAALPKPLLQPVKAISLESSDCLILCAGFEDRVLGVLDSTLLESASFKVIVIEYLPFVPQNRSAIIREKCVRHGISFSDVTYDRQNPTGFGEILLEQLAKCNGRIFIDVSAMSRLLIVQILVALGNRKARFNHCFVAYAEATNYPPSQDEVKAKIAKRNSDPTYSVLFLSSGVFEVTIVPELSSASIPTGQTRLIAFPSLEAYQLTALRAELQPSRFTLINGIPPSPVNAWRLEAIKRINRVDTVKHDTLTTSTLDYRETLDGLLRLYGIHSERERLLISPTGSKMQTVAVGLFRAFMDDVQIVYPTPKQFRSPDNYTNGVGQLYILPLEGFSIKET